ncbi:MAG: flagellar protein FlgN [Anaerolineaceae bacterium]|nr:flagellar protein FlgN [Anaerolineaceae bacterium]
MVQHDEFVENLMELESILVKQFRSLQELIEKTRFERKLLLTGDDALMRVVEDKEALLDQLGLIEDNRRKLVQNLSLAKGIQTETTSINELLPYLQEDIAERFSRLVEGITTLAFQARDLNRANQAISTTKLEWLKATQSFLIRIAQPEIGYRPPGSAPVLQRTAGLGVEFRI